MLYIFQKLSFLYKQDVREAYAYFFPEQESDPVTAMLVSINQTLLQRKSCSVHMTAFEIVIHRKS